MTKIVSNAVTNTASIDTSLGAMAAMGVIATRRDAIVTVNMTVIGTAIGTSTGTGMSSPGLRGTRSGHERREMHLIGTPVDTASMITAMSTDIVILVTTGKTSTLGIAPPVRRPQNGPAVATIGVMRALGVTNIGTTTTHR